MAAPALDADIRTAIEGKKVGDPDIKRIMSAFAKGYGEASEKAWKALQ